MFDICEIMGLCVTTRVSLRPTVIGKKLFDFYFGNLFWKEIPFFEL